MRGINVMIPSQRLGLPEPNYKEIRLFLDTADNFLKDKSKHQC